MSLFLLRCGCWLKVWVFRWKNMLLDQISTITDFCQSCLLIVVVSQSMHHLCLHNRLLVSREKEKRRVAFVGQVVRPVLVLHLFWFAVFHPHWPNKQDVCKLLL